MSQRVRRRSHLTLLLACGTLGATLSVALGVGSPALLEPLELSTVDWRFRVRGPMTVADPEPTGLSKALVSVDFDDDAVHGAGIGRWPHDRRLHLVVIDWLREGGARSIVLDLMFLFRGRDEADDETLARITNRAGNVVHPVVFRVVSETARTEAFAQAAARHLLQADVSGTGMLVAGGDVWLPLPSLVETAAALGHVQRTPDADGVLRRIPIVIAVRGGFVPGLGLAAAMRHLDADPASLRIERGRAVRFTPRQGPEIRIPIDAHGYTWINYAGPWGRRFHHYPYSWLLGQMRDPDARPRLTAWFEGRTAVVANFETASSDLGATPYDRLSHYGEVHLHVANMILTRRFLREGAIGERALASAAPPALVTAAAILGGPALLLTTGAVALVAMLAVAQMAFAYAGVIVPVVGPALALALTIMVLLAARTFIVDRERIRFQTALGACLPPQTVQAIRESPDRVPQLLAGRRRELSVMFVDIVGFSTYCQGVDPLEIQRILREYLTAMTDVIREHGGTLDKYMGDGILAFFGDADPDTGSPDEEEERVGRQAANAVSAALGMQRRMAALNATWQSQGRAPHAIRIGINTGVVTVGNLGTAQLWDYTVIGAEVNKAQRLEGAAEAGNILLSRRTYALARRHGVLREDLAPVSASLKGIGEASDLYRVRV